MNDCSQPQPSFGRHAKVTRRRFTRLLAGGALFVTGGCRYGRASSAPDAPSPTVPPRNVDSHEQAPTVVPSKPPATRTNQPTPIPASPTASVRPESQILYRGGFSADPASHDFNANLYCGGDPSVFSGLLTVNTDLTPMGDWAEKWSSNDDSSQWTFHLRPNNTGWSNGDPVSANDFVWSWRRLVDPKTNAPQAWLLDDVANAIEIRSGKADPSTLGVRAVDQWTLEVSLIGPRVYFPAIVATVGTAPAYRPAVDRFGDKWTEADHIVTNGPFKLTQWTHGENWRTEPNGGHWNSANLKLAETVVPVTPQQKHQQPYFNTQVDFMPVADEDVANVRSISDYSTQMSPSTDPSIWFLIVNPELPPFDDLRVRKAISHALDRDRFEQLSQGRASGAHSMIPPIFPLRGEDDAVTALQQFDVDQSLQLLSVTRYAGGHDWPAVTLLSAENSELPQLLVNDCAQQLLENIGLTVEVKTVSASEYDGALASRSAGLYWHRWDFTYPDPNNGYSDAIFPIGTDAPLLPLVPDGFGDLVGRGKAEQDPDARAAIYRQCETALQSAVSYIPIAYPVTFYLIRPWVAGFPLVGNSSVLQPGLIFTRLTSLVSIKGRAVG